jgi:hypothetical protein
LWITLRFRQVNASLVTIQNLHHILVACKRVKIVFIVFMFYRKK